MADHLDYSMMLARRYLWSDETKRLCCADWTKNLGLVVSDDLMTM